MKTFRSIETIFILTVSIAFISCNFSSKKTEPVWSDLPEVTSLDELKQTNFVTTLEHPFTQKKNIIYAPAFLYAWDKIKVALTYPILADSTNSSDFQLLNQSTSYQNSLTEKEYSAKAEIVDGVIIAKAFFDKTLPFETKLQVLDDPIHFDTTKVSAFGMHYYDDELIKFTKILYYKDDNNFILHLSPKDKQHEIILVKGIDNYRSLSEAIKFTQNLIEEGRQDQANAKVSWKYTISEVDVFAIPVIMFNIATHYKGLEGQQFSTKANKEYAIKEAYQRTGFIFNENGAVVESEAAVAVDSTSATIPAQPKNMTFDKPFLIIIKRVDKTNPYFVMRVANAELMKIK